MTIKQAIVLLLALGMIVRGQLSDNKNKQLTEALSQAQSDLLVKEIQAQDWSVAVAEEVDNLNDALMQRGDSLDRLSLLNAQLAHDVNVLNGQLREMTSMYAEAVGQIEVEPTVVTEDSVTAVFNDGLLSGRLVYRNRPTLLAINPYRVTLRLATGWVELPNGDMATVARSEDARVQLTVTQSVVSKPEPVLYCASQQKMKWSFYGAAGAGLLSLIFN